MCMFFSTLYLFVFDRVSKIVEFSIYRQIAQKNMCGILFFHDAFTLTHGSILDGAQILEVCNCVFILQKYLKPLQNPPTKIWFCLWRCFYC